MFSHLYLPKVLFLIPVDPSQVVNSLLSHSSCYLLHSRISARWTPFQNFSGQPFFIHSSHVTIPAQMFIFYAILHRIFNIQFSLITLFPFFSNLEHLADLLKKSISSDISFDSFFIFRVSTPYVAEIFTIELYVINCNL